MVCVRHVLFLILFVSPALAQTSSVHISKSPEPELMTHPDWPRADDAEVASIDSTVAAFYRAVSAQAGQKLDRVRLRSLFVPGGRLVIGLPKSKNHDADVIFVSPDEYADKSDAMTAHQGFFDRVIANQVEQFGVIAHVFGAYESRHLPADPKPFSRGIKSIDLLNSRGRWYIVQVYYGWEDADHVLPDAYLHDHTR